MKGWIVSGCMVGPLFTWKKIIIVSLHWCSRKNQHLSLYWETCTLSTEPDRLQGHNSQTGFKVLPEAMKDQLSTGSSIGSLLVYQHTGPELDSWQKLVFLFLSTTTTPVYISIERTVHLQRINCICGGSTCV